MVYEMSATPKELLEKNRTEMKKQMNSVAAGLSEVGIKSRVYGPSIMRIIGYILDYKSKIKSKSKMDAQRGRTLRASKADIEQNLRLQTNSNQVHDGRLLVKLLQKLGMNDHMKGNEVMNDIKKNKDEPYRHFFMFFSDSGEVVGFISATKVPGQNTAVVDYISPNVRHQSKFLKEYLAYAVLNMLWLNKKHTRRYERVLFKDKVFSTLGDVESMLL